MTSNPFGPRGHRVRPGSFGWDYIRRLGVWVRRAADTQPVDMSKPDAAWPPLERLLRSGQGFTLSYSGGGGVGVGVSVVRFVHSADDPLGHHDRYIMMLLPWPRNCPVANADRLLLAQAILGPAAAAVVDPKWDNERSSVFYGIQCALAPMLPPNDDNVRFVHWRAYP